MMATLLLFQTTRQTFRCPCIVRRTLFLARTNSNSLFSASTSKKLCDIKNVIVNTSTASTCTTSTINRLPFSTLQRIGRKPSTIKLRRLSSISSTNRSSCFLSLSPLKTTQLRRIELLGNAQKSLLFPGNRGESFHSTPVRHVAPVIWMVVKPVAKLIALFGGRRFRFWYKTLPIELKKLIMQRILMMMTVLTGLGALYYISHLQETPITKRLRFIAFTDEQFMKIANYEAKLQEKLEENSFLPATHPSYIRVIKIMEALVRGNWAVSNMKTQKWKVAIVDSADINAYVLATGHVYVHVGLLNFVQNDDQLAIVLAHEIAHALLGHAAEKVSFAQMMDYFVIIVMAAIWAFMPFDGIALITQAFYEKVVEILFDNPYSRKLEREADIVGLELAAKACFDVREGSNFWRLMQFSEKLEGTGTPEWLSTHPSNVKRQELIEHLIPKAISTRDQCRCNPLSENDPRDCLKDMEKLVKNVLAARMARQNLEKLQKDPAL